MRRAPGVGALVLAGVLARSPAAFALEVHFKAVSTSSHVVRASIELRDVVPDRFRKVLDDNGALHLRLQAELWESRPVWDRLVYPALLQMVRIRRDAMPPSPWPVTLDLGKTDRLEVAGKYYVHIVATLGTLAERDADDVGDAVFGRESETNGLGSLGRLVFRTALRFSDYLQSVTAEVKSKKLTGAELLKP
jgi:hypothetical protein